jgi:formate/nitrite transporter FocA (FNT family)
MKAFYAGIIIGLGAAANLLIGGLPGAVIFSFGLLMICALQYDLFTGKIGATILGEYKLGKLVAAFFFNFAGVLLVNLLLLFSPMYSTLVEKATVIA